MADKSKANTASGGGSLVQAEGPAANNPVIPTSSSSAMTNFPARNPQVTYDAEPIEHWISDMDLDQLKELRKDNVIEIFWGVLGIFLGSILPALEKLPKIGNAASPIGPLDLIVLLFCLVSLALTVILAFFWRQRAKGAADIVEKIRNRKKFRVSDANG